MTGPVTRLVLAPIRFYQRVVSPGLPPRCRYAPTCSQYAVEALEVHGPLKGLILAVWRLLRCNPWSAGGVDHVPPRGRWRPDPWIPPEDWAGYDDASEAPVPMGMEAAPQRPGREPATDASPAPAGRPGGASGVPLL